MEQQRQYTELNFSEVPERRGQSAPDTPRAVASPTTGGYVPVDYGAAWTAATGTAARSTFATFPGQSISASPTQAEVQAIDNHVKILSQRLKALIDDLKANGALT